VVVLWAPWRCAKIGVGMRDQAREVEADSEMPSIQGQSVGLDRGISCEFGLLDIADAVVEQNAGRR